ncbi:hypothetical protein SDJN02_12638, partial [Cucurbita argyrosperma subsp. argyrosperma]
NEENLTLSSSTLSRAPYHFLFFFFFTWSPPPFQQLSVIAPLFPVQCCRRRHLSFARVVAAPLLVVRTEKQALAGAVRFAAKLGR